MFFILRWDRLTCANDLKVTRIIDRVSSRAVDTGEEIDAQEDRCFPNVLEEFDTEPVECSKNSSKRRKTISYNSVLDLSKDIASMMATTNHLQEYYTFLTLLKGRLENGELNILSFILTGQSESLHVTPAPRAGGLPPAAGRPVEWRIESVPVRMRPRPKERNLSCSFCGVSGHLKNNCPRIYSLGQLCSLQVIDYFKSLSHSTKISKCRVELGVLSATIKCILVRNLGIVSNVAEAVCHILPVSESFQPQLKEAVWIHSTKVGEMVLAPSKTVILCRKC